MAQAQVSPPSVVDTRIQGVFEIVPQNVPELAVPLTRRALSRRAFEARLPPLPYRAADASPADPAALLQQQVSGAAATMVTVPLEFMGPVAEADADPMDVARLPRPRPAAGEAGAEIVGDPFDLVAGAPLPETEIPVAEPQDLLADEEQGSVDPEMEVALLPAAAPEREQPSPAAAPVPGPAASAPPAGRAPGECLVPGAVKDRDGDFRRNAEALADPSLCIGVLAFKEQRRPWTIQTVDSGRPGPLWTVMHDNEDIAFDTAVRGLERYGGVLLAVETGGKRNQDGIDPNRNFSADGTGCAKLGADRAPKFAAAFRDRYSARPVIALHNNDDGPIPTGGVGHVTMNNVPKSMRSMRSRTPDGPLAGDHALVLLAATDLEDDSVSARMQSLSAKGVNVVVERVRPGRGDCSLSNDTLLAGNPDYFNITVDHDEGGKQTQIVDAVMSIYSTVTAGR